MKITAILAAAIIAGGASMAMAQSGSGAAGGASGGAGSDVSTPRKNMQRPTANSPAASRRGDDMPNNMNSIPMNSKMGMKNDMGMKKGMMHKGMKHKKMSKKHMMMKKKEM
jgi:hypothetical protein